MPLSQVQKREMDRAVKKIDEKEQSLKGKEETPVKSLPNIPQEAFRPLTYIYQDEAKKNHLYYKMDEEASDEIVGYLTEPLQAPGYEDFKLESKNYPRVTVEELRTFKGIVKPIVVLNNEIDLMTFIEIAKLNKNPLYDYSMKAFNSGQIVWFLPDESGLAVDKNCESLQQAIDKLQEKSGGKEQNQDSEDQETAQKVEKNMKKLLYWLIAIFVIVLTVVFTVESKFFNHTFTKDNKLIDYSQLYQIMELPNGASKKDIKKQYRKLAVEYHPDRNPDCADCAEKFDKISNAYKTLLPGDAHIPTSFESDDTQVVKMKR